YGIRHNPEIRVVQGTTGSVWRAELRMVKDVEELRAEFKVHGFCDCSSLEHREVKVVDALLAQGGIYPRFVSVGPSIPNSGPRGQAGSFKAGLLEACRINPPAKSRYCTSGGILVTARNNIGSERRRLTKEPRTGKGGSPTIANLYRKAALEGGDAIHAPTRNEFTNSASGTAQEPLSFAKRQIKDVADN